MPKRNLTTRLQLITERLEAIERALGERITTDDGNAPEPRTKKAGEKKIGRCKTSGSGPRRR